MKEIKITIPDGTKEILDKISERCSSISEKKVDCSKLARYAVYRLLQDYSNEHENKFGVEFWSDPYYWIKHLDVMHSMKLFEINTPESEIYKHIEEVENM